MPARCVLAVLTLILACSIASAAEIGERSFVLRDHAGHRWTDELVHYELSLPPGQFWPTSVVLRNEPGDSVPVQFTNTKLHPDGSLASGAMWFLVDQLPANGTRTYKLAGGEKDKPSTPSSDLSLVREQNSAVIATSRMAIRILLGDAHFASPEAAEKLPAPIQGIRLRGGQWTGRGRIETQHRCIGYTARIVENGPVFKSVVIRYSFVRPQGWDREGELFNEMTVRVAAGQEAAYITEEYNLGDPKVYQVPKFASERQEMLWDWWSWRPHEAADNFRFSLTAGGPFAPTHARCINHNVTTPTKGTGMGLDRGENEYAIPFEEDRLEFTLNALSRLQPDQAVLYTLFRKDDPASDVVSILPCRPGRWRNPDMLPHEPALIKQHTDTGDLRVYSTKQREVFVRAPLHLGRREWAIAVLMNPGIVEPDVRDFTPLAGLVARYGGFSLDKVKDWTLEWPDGHAYADAPAAHDSAIEKEYREVSGHLSRYVRDALNWPRGGERNGINSFPPGVGKAVTRVRALLESGKLTAEQGRRLRAQAAFMTHYLWDDDYFPPRRNGYGGGSSNMPVSVARGRMAAAGGLVGHPLRGEWLAQSAKQMRYAIDASFGPDGSPQSNPHYMGIGVDTAVDAARVLGEAGAIKDVKSEFPTFHKAARFMVDMLTPQDVRLGIRLVPTVGDGYWERHENAAAAAPVFKESDPELAANLHWAARAGGVRDAKVEGVQPRAPATRSVLYPGWGAFLRRGFDTKDEHYIGIRFGDFTLDHTHNDAGSVNWYARGVPLALDFATMYTPHTSGAWLHSTLTYDHREHARPVRCPGQGHKDCFYTGKPWYAHEFEPHTVIEPTPDRAALDFTEVHGKITAFATQPAADYVRGEANRKWLERRPYFHRHEGSPSPWGQFTEWDKVELRRPFRWVRQFAFVTDERPDGPNYLVITDDLTGNEELDPAFNFWCLATDAKEPSPRRFRFAGQHGVDLDMAVLSPAAGDVKLGEWGHKQGFLIGSKGLEENQKLVRVYGGRGGGGFAVVLYPRKPGEAEPKVERVGPLVRVILPDQTHWILLSKEPVEATDGPVKVRATAAVIKRWNDGRASVTLLASGAAECDGVRLESNEPATKSR